MKTVTDGPEHSDTSPRGAGVNGPVAFLPFNCIWIPVVLQAGNYSLSADVVMIRLAKVIEIMMYFIS